MKPLLVAATADRTRVLPLGRRRGDMEALLTPSLPAVSELDLDRPLVILLDRSFMASVPHADIRLRELAQVAALVWCATVGERQPPEGVPAGLLTTILPSRATAAITSTLLAGAMRHAIALREERVARRESEQRRRELFELAQVGSALGTEHELLSLLDLILTQARRMTGSDAASLYLVEDVGRESSNGAEPSAPALLRFKLSQNHSLPDLALSEFVLPVDHESLAGHAAATGRVVVVPDVYLVGADVPYRPNHSFDERFGYRTRSVLVVPLRTHARGVVGVLQLINRKRTPDVVLASIEDVDREVLPFDQRSAELVTGLAAHAAVALDNSRLYDSIARLFESFVTASVTAVEQRDPTTSGHSLRVATLTVGLAEALATEGRGRYANMCFTREALRELRYAALLHDFGKVGVREEVLVKGKKLYPVELQRIRARLQRLMQEHELRYERARGDYLLQHGQRGFEDACATLRAERDERLAHLRLLLRRVEEANEPSMLPEDRFDELERLAAAPFCDARGRPVALLTPDELTALRVRQGSLGVRERHEIESHVEHSWRFLSQIPWTPELRNIPDIVYGHHEKLDGSGYPRHVGGAEVPAQARMMTIADIFDALTATDRPYKRAVSYDRAFEILREEARLGQLDADLVETFIEAGVWKLTADQSAISFSSSALR